MTINITKAREHLYDITNREVYLKKQCVLIKNKIKANENIDLIVIDYLHLLTHESPTGNVLNDLSILSGNLKSFFRFFDNFMLENKFFFYV